MQKSFQKHTRFYTRTAYRPVSLFRSPSVRAATACVPCGPTHSDRADPIAYVQTCEGGKVLCQCKLMPCGRQAQLAWPATSRKNSHAKPAELPSPVCILKFLLCLFFHKLLFLPRSVLLLGLVLLLLLKLRSRKILGRQLLSAFVFLL